MIPFLTYLGCALVLLTVFGYCYEKFTPYDEFVLIKHGNTAAAISFGGALLGFTIPLVSVIFYTHSLLEMAKWAVITGLVQALVFFIANKVFNVKSAVDNNIA